MTHHLDPLLRPRSVAIVGASAREDSMGEWSLANLLRGGFQGNIYPVNPGYSSLQGVRCYRSLADLPETPELVIFAVGDARIERAVDQAIAADIPAGVIMCSLYIDDDAAPYLMERVRQKVLAAGMLVCGANGMGFYNFRDHTWGCGFDSRQHNVEGNVSLISHSGSGMSGIIDCEERLRVNLAVSTGNELSVSMDQYLDFALDLPETKAVGLFIETARNPTGFRAALRKAARLQIPIVALKVGRTQKAAELAVSHSGAMAGDDATYTALFGRYGVHRVDDMDELATALIMFAELNPLGPGELVAMHDSGGERQLMVDLAEQWNTPLTELSDHTVESLKLHLDPELPALNPLDSWSRGGEDASEQMKNCLATMMQDSNAALGAVMHDRAPDGLIYESYVDYLKFANEASGKPVALVAARQGTGSDPRVVEITHQGFPVLDGVVPFLKGVRGLINYRDFVARPAMKVNPAPKRPQSEWVMRLSSAPDLDELTALEMLRDFGVESSVGRQVESEEELLSAARALDYPLVIKTTMPGIAHKSDCGGVVLNISDASELRQAYKNMSLSLGPHVLVSEMAASGIEMILGARSDPQFGPVIVIGFGGTLTEVITDVTFALPPFDEDYARRCVDSLRMRPLLDGVRGAGPVDVESFCVVASRFSVMVDALRQCITEIDVNPIIVNEKGSIAVDALVVCDTP